MDNLWCERLLGAFLDLLLTAGACLSLNIMLARPIYASLRREVALVRPSWSSYILGDNFSMLCTPPRGDFRDVEVGDRGA